MAKFFSRCIYFISVFSGWYLLHLLVLSEISDSPAINFTKNKNIVQPKNEKSSLRQFIIHYKPASVQLWVNCLLWTVLQLLRFMLVPYKLEIGIFITSGHNLNCMSLAPCCRLLYCHTAWLLFWHTTMQLTHELHHQ